MSSQINVKRLAAATVVATIADLVYGAVVYGMALTGEMEIYNALFRRVDQVNANLPWLVGGLATTTMAVAYLYAVSSRKFGLVGGLRFGAILAAIMVGYVSVGNYVVLRIGERLAALMAMACFIEWLMVGAIIGLVYHPQPVPSVARR